MRYHGQLSRGRQTNAALDAQDLNDAIKALSKAKSGLAFAASPSVQAMPRIQQAAVKREALSLAALGVRFIADVLSRNRYRADLAIAAPAPLDGEAPGPDT